VVKALCNFINLFIDKLSRFKNFKDAKSMNENDVKIVDVILDAINLVNYNEEVLV